MKNILRKYKIIERAKLKKIKDSEKKLSLQLDFLRKIKSNNYSKLVENLDFLQSQFFQDLFVLDSLDFKKNGYFVEFGATNGVDLSNTFILEKKFNWQGILAEPSRNWHKKLKINRTNFIETDCVWKTIGERLLFLEANVGEYSTLFKTANHDKNLHKRKNAKRYYVSTISLNDLLSKYEAPKEIDYLSIDTEGSEYEILRNFNFNNYKIKIISCEHNYGENREKIFSLTTGNGYKRIYQTISYCDDWYIRDAI